ncbi:MAG: CHAD domain-containing protein [Candidatus Acidiferrales bacterium]
MALDTERLVNNIRKLRKLLKKTSKLRTPKGVHDLRTRTRRIEALLPAAGFDSPRNQKRVLRELRPIRKKAGKVRDMDVFTTYLLQLNVDGERECAVQLAEYLGAERFRHCEKLRRSVKNGAGDLRKRLKRLSRDVEAIAGRGADHPAKAGTPRTNAASFALELASELDEPGKLNRNNLHPYRLKVKELRYILKSAKGDTDRRFIDALGECKDSIGEWHDWAELAAIAGDVLDHGRDCKLMDQLKSVSHQKLEAALSIAKAMRRQFVSASEPHGRRSSRAKSRTRQPGFEAAAAISRRVTARKS